MIVGGHYFIMCWCGGWRPFKLFRHLRTILNCDCASLVKIVNSLCKVRAVSDQNE